MITLGNKLLCNFCNYLSDLFLHMVGQGSLVYVFSNLSVEVSREVSFCNCFGLHLNIESFFQFVQQSKL